MSPSVMVFLGALLAQAAPGREVSVGASIGWLERSDYGSASPFYLSPELAVQLRSPLRPAVSLRPTLRLGFVGLEQPDMPSALAMHERDLTLAAEAALSYDARLRPWLGLGTLVVGRKVAVRAAPPVRVEGSHLGGLDLLLGTYAQAGVGLTLADGLVILGPSARLQWLHGDPRAHWRLALDVAVRVR